MLLPLLPFPNRMFQTRISRLPPLEEAAAKGRREKKEKKSSNEKINPVLLHHTLYRAIKLAFLMDVGIVTGKQIMSKLASDPDGYTSITPWFSDTPRFTNLSQPWTILYRGLVEGVASEPLCEQLIFLEGELHCFGPGY